MKVVIVIPTYNEGENLQKILPALQSEFNQIKNHQCHVLIVDGNSEDRTQEIVLGFSEQNPNFHLFVETEKEGIGAAYVKGFQKAMKEHNADVVIEMDGDMQHNPADIKRFINEIENGYDYVIGSRYVDGGSIPKEWNALRKFLSWGGSTFARVVLGIWNIKDITTGYKATRVNGFLDKLNFDEITSKSFAYKIDLLYKMYKLGAKIKEIPIEFGLRDRGNSKIERNTFLDSLRVVLILKLRENSSFYKFLATGFVGMFVDFFFANLFKFAEIREGYAATLAAVLAMLTTFTLNNNWSFNSQKISGYTYVLKTIPLYIFSSFIPIFVRFNIVEWCVGNFGNTYLVYNLALFISVLLGTLWNYLIYSRVIWRKK